MDKNAVVLALPSVLDMSFRHYFGDVVRFYTNLIGLLSKYHQCVLMCDGKTAQYYHEVGLPKTVRYDVSFPPTHCLDAFPISCQNGLIKFHYQPQTLPINDSKRTHDFVKRWLLLNKVPTTNCNTILDRHSILISPCKNVCIITEQVYYDNAEMLSSQTYNTLKLALGVKQLIVMPLCDRTTIRPISSICNFISASAIMLNQFPTIYYKRVLNALIEVLPDGCKVVDGPFNKSVAESKTNFIMTNKVCVVPSLTRKNDETIKVICDNCQVNVETIDAEVLTKSGTALNSLVWN